jgi:hypothetical protein
MKLSRVMGGVRQGPEINNARWVRVSGWRCFFLIIVGALSGCSELQGSPRVANPNRYIYVTGASLPGQCYRDLGTVGFDEPFAAATIDEGGAETSAKIRTLAVAKYPNDVDAIIDVHNEQNDAGTEEKVVGEAVEIVNHPTVACALRDLPPILDSSAAAANAGIIGTVAGGLISGSPGTAAAMGMAGAAAAGGQQLIAHQQSEQIQREQLYQQLLDQQRQIRGLLAERARLNSCDEQEISLSNCGADAAAQEKENEAISTPADYQNLPLFELQKQSAEDQDYVTKLKQQVSQLKWQMEHPSLQ